MAPHLKFDCMVAPIREFARKGSSCATTFTKGALHAMSLAMHARDSISNGIWLHGCSNPLQLNSFLGLVHVDSVCLWVARRNVQGICSSVVVLGHSVVVLGCSFHYVGGQRLVE